MATKKSTPVSRELTVEKNYTSWQQKHKINDKKTFESMAKVRNSYERSNSFLMSSCFWDAFQETSTAAAVSGGSWYDRWSLQEKMALMWYRKPSVDDFMSNIKSPMARGRISTFVNQMKKLNFEFGARPNNDDVGDRNASIIADKTINTWYKNSNASLALSDAYEDLGTHGNAYLGVKYVKDDRWLRFPKYSQLSDEEKKKVDAGDQKLVYGDPKRYSIIDDIVVEHIPLREIYQDPQARNLHGDSYRAGWVVRKRYVTLNYLKAIYEDDPRVDFLDKVQGSSSYRDMSEYFFEPPKDNMGGDIVELLEMEDQDNDLFYVVANDICIIGSKDDEPLPYNHKEISVHKLDFIRMPGQYFSIGICDLLDNIQSSYEVTLNMVADYVYRTYNYKLLVDADNFGEITGSVQRTGDMFIPVDVSDGRPIQSKIMPLTVSPIGFDIFQFLQILEKNATLATNIDPAQMAQLAGSKTATSDILNKELMMTMIGGVIDNNVDGDLRSVGRQVWKLQQQFYTKPRVEAITGDDEKQEFKPRQLRFEGMKIEVNNDSGLLEEKESDDKYSFFDLTDEYLSTKDELDIFITPDSTEPESKELAERKMNEEFAQLMPFAVDPNNPMQVQQHQMPMIDINKLFKEYFEVHRLPEKLLLNQNKDSDTALQEAETHVMKILANQFVQAIPGQSSVHLEYEYQVLDAMTFTKEQKEQEIQKEMESKMQMIMKNMPQFDPMTGAPISPEQMQQMMQQMPMPGTDPQKEKEIQDLSEVIDRLQKHLVIESMPASMRNSRIVTGPDKQEPPQPQQGAQMPPAPSGMQNQITPDMLSGQDPAGAVPMGQNPVPNNLAGMMQ